MATYNDLICKIATRQRDNQRHPNAKAKDHNIDQHNNDIISRTNTQPNN